MINYIQFNLDNSNNNNDIINGKNINTNTKFVQKDNNLYIHINYRFPRGSQCQQNGDSIRQLGLSCDMFSLLKGLPKNNNCVRHEDLPF